MNEQEFAELKADIQEQGLLEPIITYEGKILDGRNRFMACNELGIKPEFVPYTGNTPLHYVVSKNLKRRHLTAAQKAFVALEIEKRLGEIAKKQQGTRTDIFANCEKVDFMPIRAEKQAAEIVGTGSRYVSEAKNIQEKAPDLVPQLKAGELTIPKAKAEINRRERAAFMVESVDIRVPEGKYRTIVIDPPWPIEKIQREVAPNQVGFEYPTMTLTEIEKFEIPMQIADDDCHLFMWTTQKYLPDAFKILSIWGFKYIFTMVWHKPGGFQPFNLPQYNCEFILYGRKGTPEFTDLKDFPTCFDAPRREHSRKPDEFYNLIRRVAPGPRIDIFSREKRDGFDQYGNETDKFK